MTNDMHELTDEQLAEIAGAGISINPVVQVVVAPVVQTAVGIAPTVGVAIGSKLNVSGAKLGVGNKNNLLAGLDV